MCFRCNVTASSLFFFLFILFPSLTPRWFLRHLHRKREQTQAGSCRGSKNEVSTPYRCRFYQLSSALRDYIHRTALIFVFFACERFVEIHRSTVLRSGHSKLIHEQLITKQSPPYCQSYGSPIIVQHILLGCYKFSSERNSCNVEIDMKSEWFSIRNTLEFFKRTNLVCSM